MNKKMPPKKKQHWVPYFYLKNWATDDSKNNKFPQGWILSINKGEPQKVNLRDFAAKRYLYSPPDKNGKRNFITEDKLSDYESVMSTLWSKISNEFYDFSKGTSLRKGIALFMSLMYLRNPANINLIKEVHTKLIDVVEWFPKDKNGNPSLTKIIHKGMEYKVDISDYADYKNSSQIDFQNMFIEHIHREAIPIAETFINKRWAIVVSEKDHFITSDNPVIVENINRDVFGLNTKGTITIFPISPKRILVMDDVYEVADGNFYALKDNNPAIYNYTIWRLSNDFMLSKRHPDLICKEIVDYANKIIYNK